MSQPPTKTAKRSKCPRCFTYEPPEWTERSIDGLSKCSQCGAESPNPAWIVREPVANTETDRIDEIRARVRATSRTSWRSMRDGNQYLDGDREKLVGASRVDGLPRAWNPHFVKPAIELEHVSRFKDEDADFIANAREDISWLLEEVTTWKRRAAALIASKSEMKRVATLDPQKAAEELARLREENERLREALEKYGRHFCDCPYLDNKECGCGLSLALKEGRG